MSTKYFKFDGGVANVISGLNYMTSHANPNTPAAYGIHNAPLLAIQAWHAISQGERNALINRLAAAGWIEGEQSKPD